MSEHDDKVYLEHMQEAVLDIERFLSGYTEQQFLTDEKTRYAVLYKLEVIGEAAGRLSKGLKAKYQQVPWSIMSDMRNVLVHEYDGVNFTTVWNVYEKDLPELKSNLQEIIKSL